MSTPELAPNQPKVHRRTGSSVDRLNHARHVLDQASTAWAARTATALVPEAELIPVAAPLRLLFPGGGLRRGTVVQLRRSTALLFALLAEASKAETWCAIVGMPELGVVAAEEAGVDLARTAILPSPGADLIAVSAALIDGIDLVALADTNRLRAGDRQPLAARARQRGAVLLSVGTWPGADLVLDLHSRGWQGILGPGHGRLRSHQVRVRAHGKAAARRGREVSVLLPGPTGELAAAGAAQALGPRSTALAHPHRRPA